MSLTKQELANRIVEQTPYLTFLGIRFECHGDELTAILPFSEDLIGNPFLPALHGGATGAFLEITALTDLALVDWQGEGEALPPQPKTIDLTIDYLRAGKPQDCYARARILRKGRRVANLRVEAWQEERSRPIASAHGNFLLPGAVGE